MLNINLSHSMIMQSRVYLIIFIIFTFLNYFVCESKRSKRTKKKHHHKRNITIEGKIVGGKPASLENYPYAVQFFNMGGLCGGVILNSWTVITSAHCLASNTNTEEMVVQAGSKYIYDFNSEKYKVKSFVIHEDYNKEQIFSCDIALIFLERPIKLGKLAKKGILVTHDKWMDEREKKFVVAGWGWTKYGGDVSKGLMTTHLQYVSPKECTRLHNSYKLTPDMFCLYGDGKRDTCRGDSGGGVLWNDMLVGLTSHGDGCANKDSPSVYTNLWVLRNWIKKHVYEFVVSYCMDQYRSKKEN